MFAVKRFHRLSGKEFEKVDCITLHSGFFSSLVHNMMQDLALGRDVELR